ncbi:MAG: hypothetical protein WCW02_03575 [Candidatus Buchananbacteria bacterium]
MKPITKKAVAGVWILISVFFLFLWSFMLALAFMQKLLFTWELPLDVKLGAIAFTIIACATLFVLDAYIMILQDQIKPENDRDLLNPVTVAKTSWNSYWFPAKQ